MTMDTRATLLSDVQARARLSELLDRVEAGEEISIARHGRTIAKLIASDGAMPGAVSPTLVKDYISWLKREGPKLGPNLSLRDLIEQGRRY